jgi:hypothetical protein
MIKQVKGSNGDPRNGLCFRLIGVPYFGKAEATRVALLTTSPGHGGPPLSRRREKLGT